MIFFGDYKHSYTFLLMVLVSLFFIFSISSCYYMDMNGLDSFRNQNILDEEAPIPGDAGLIHLANKTSNSIEISWCAATDDRTGQADLEYSLIYSTSDNISTLSDAENNGTKYGLFTQNLLSITVTGLVHSTTYYFNVIVRDEAGNSNVYSQQSETLLSDVDVTTPPVPGSMGDITLSNLSSDSVDVGWDAATDNLTAPSDLEYILYYSTSSDLSTLSEIDNNGTKIIIGTYTNIILSKTVTVTGLNETTLYYFNLVVIDEQGNRAPYGRNSATTLDGTPPEPGDSGAIAFSNPTAHTIQLDWTESTDLISAQANLEYLVCYSTSDNITTVADAEANGSAFGSYASDISNATVTGLNDQTTYFFNVIVRDEAGNKAVYTSGSYTMPDAVPPAQIELTGLFEGDTEITFTWNDPSDADFERVEITWIPNGSTVRTVVKGTENFTATGLNNLLEYKFSFVTIDEFENRSAPYIICTQPDALGPTDSHFIYNADDLNNVRNELGASYIMMDDVDLSAYSSWTPIGTSTMPFTGSLNGNGHKITGLTINDPASDYQGLFGYINGRTRLKNITIEECDITGRDYVAAIVGVFNRNGFADDTMGISMCYVSGEINGRNFVAGMIGYIASSSSGSNSYITNCGADVTVSGNYFCGGFAARLQENVIVQNCFSEGSVSGVAVISGFVGSSNCNVNDCYSRSEVEGDVMLGGFFGQSTGTPSNCFSTGNIMFVSPDSTIGGFAGDMSGRATPNCYYSGVLANGLPDNVGGTRKSVEEMKTASTFAGYDFVNIWAIDLTMAINDGFPYFRANPPR